MRKIAALLLPDSGTNNEKAADDPAACKFLASF